MRFSERPFDITDAAISRRRVKNRYIPALKWLCEVLPQNMKSLCGYHSISSARMETNPAPSFVSYFPNTRDIV